MKKEKQLVLANDTDGQTKLSEPGQWQADLPNAGSGYADDCATLANFPELDKCRGCDRRPLFLDRSWGRYHGDSTGGVSKPVTRARGRGRQHDHAAAD